MSSARTTVICQHQQHIDQHSQRTPCEWVWKSDSSIKMISFKFHLPSSRTFFRIQKFLWLLSATYKHDRCTSQERTCLGLLQNHLINYFLYSCYPVLHISSLISILQAFNQFVICCGLSHGHGLIWQSKRLQPNSISLSTYLCIVFFF